MDISLSSVNNQLDTVPCYIESHYVSPTDLPNHMATIGQGKRLSCHFIILLEKLQIRPVRPNRTMSGKTHFD